MLGQYMTNLILQRFPSLTVIWQTYACIHTTYSTHTIQFLMALYYIGSLAWQNIWKNYLYGLILLLFLQLSKTERKAEKNLELSIEQRNRTNNPSFPVKNNGPVRRKKLKLLPM